MADIHIRIKGRELAFPVGREVQLGRDPAAEVQSDNPFVSRHHAVLRWEGSGWVLTDVGSKRGTFVDGRQVTRAPVNGRMELWLGQVGEGQLLEIEARPDEPYRPVEEATSGGSSGWFPDDGGPPAPAAPVAARPAGRARRPPQVPKGWSAKPRTSGGREPVRRGRETVSGEARDIRIRSEQTRHPIQICTFRIERYDADGQRLAPVPVEMRGLSIHGVLSEGDQVQATGRWREGSLRTRRVLSLTSRSVFRVGLPFSRRTLVLILLALPILLALLVAAIAIALASQSGPVQDGLPPRPDVVVVPDVIGQEVSPATNQLDRAGLDAHWVFESSPSVAWGHVIRTDPPRRARISRGIRVDVSSGPSG